MKKLLILVGCILYVLSPVDLISDFLVVVGWLDDAAVIAATIGAMRGSPGGTPPSANGSADSHRLIGSGSPPAKGGRR